MTDKNTFPEKASFQDSIQTSGRLRQSTGLAHGAVLLRAERLSFAFAGGTPVLRDASLHLKGGASVGLLGANGAGKTTLLGALTGTVRGTTGGSVRLDVRGLPARRAIGFATQAIALYPVLTVEENVGHLARLLLGREEAKAAIARTLEEFALGPIARTRVHHLSGGQRRLVHLAASFVHAPPIRLLDEPTVALDFEARQLVVRRVRAWREEGAAVLVTAHYPEDIEELSTELVLLRDGKTRDLGTLGAVLSNQARTLSLRGARPVSPPADASWELTLATSSLEEVRSKLGEVPSDVHLSELRLSGNRLRDILLRDPSLSAFARESEGP
ncbi:ABC transporter ATP-binding protein [Corallococcus llansteffanensis]|uniref:ABC transporter ATP-binding protein n=1 Tax=Corallococcus llansteffanensis TaxID=2316731 RepID=A0A3A8Q6M8_9BACT|nr:ABC transporter ATP-binding protein [Corallococcus llansteffanensis]RKH61855.1 ABC transporter ATP-binding protein [Corallococcus llansteffanensis]